MILQLINYYILSTRYNSYIVNIHIENIHKKIKFNYEYSFICYYSIPQQ